MHIFLDTEFEGLWKTAKLISLGLISEDDKELYVEFDDIDINNQDEWIKNNVLLNTVYYGDKAINEITDINNYFVGNKEQVKSVLLDWFRQFSDVQIVSDVDHYDFVQFIDIFGTAFDLPKNICASCHDINQDIACYYNVTESEAFEINREDILNQNNLVIDGEKHNSLYDAKVIREIYKIINNGSM